MEQRMIGYTNGITRSSGDLMSEDGELMECVNLKCENGELKPLLWPEKSFELNEGEVLKYIHKGSGYENYLYISGGKVKAFYFKDGVRTDYTFEHSFSDEPKFESVGNTVVLSVADGLHYILFKNGEYKYLGQQFPECPLSFGLQGEFRTYSKNEEYLNVTHPAAFEFNNEGIVIHKDSVDSVTNQILGAVNKFIKDEVTDKGKFMFPFLVRYAYRLYDGTLTYHSAPVLMVASSYYNPYVHVKSYNTDHKSFKCDISTVVSQLDYQLVDASVKNQLAQWSDIIKSVDVFISSPIYTYNQNVKIESLVGLSDTNLSDDVNKLYDGCYYVGKIVDGDCGYSGSNKINFSDRVDYIKNGELIERYQRYFVPSLYQLMKSEPVGQYFANLSYSKGYIDEQIKDCSTFYLIKSIKTNALSSSREVIKIEESYLSSLESRERMTDEYRSHSKKYARYMFSYNSRLHLSDVNLSVFKGFKPESLFQYTNGACKLITPYTNGTIEAINLEIEDTSSNYCDNINIQIGRNDDVTEIKTSSSYSYDMREVGLYTYYPDSNGSFVIVGNVRVKNVGDYDFENHKGLNGVLSFQGLDRRNGTENASFIDAKGDFTEVEPNKIYTSDVNNPFVFNASGINTVGTGEVLGIVSVTKALSQGQFGQFPLLALCSDGIWALSVNDEGLYSTKQMVSREVCNNADSIVQTDNAVYFSSEKGLMVIDGSEVRCVTPQMEGLVSKLSDMKRMGDILKSVSEIQEMVSASDAETEFVDYLRESTIGYSYRDQSLYICHKDAEKNPYMYVYSIKNNTVTKLCNPQEQVGGFINNYPDTLMLGEKVLNKKTQVYSLLEAHELEGESSYGFAMTRPLKLGDPTAMKRIKQAKNIKNVHDKNSYVKYALWGSNDGVKWYYVGSYDGGFKYYRMGLFTKLRPNESVLGTVMLTDKKRNNKLR